MIRRLSNNLRIFEDSQYDYLYGGSKARKLKLIIDDAKKRGCDSVVSCGSINSNHIRDCAFACAQLGWKCHLVIHDKENKDSLNLQIIKMLGADVIFCSLSEVSKYMNSEMKKLKEKKKKPYYIKGGGHSVLGSLALKNAVDDFFKHNNNWHPDYVLVASGTGTTQAGLHVGFGMKLPKSKVIGISIARNKKRGKKIIDECVDDLRNLLDIEKSFKDVCFMDDWTGGGYGKKYPKLQKVIDKYYKKGVITDSCYTGKVFCAYEDLISSNAINTSSNVLIWHTGSCLSFIGDLKK